MIESLKMKLYLVSFLLSQTFLFTHGFEDSIGPSCSANEIGSPHQFAGTTGGFTISAPARYEPGEEMIFTISGGEIGGIMVYCNDAIGTRVGSFETSSSSMGLKTCYGVTNSVIHHTRELETSSVRVNFIAPSQPKGPLTCEAAIVEDENSYFVVSVTIDGDGAPAPTSPAPAPTSPGEVPTDAPEESGDNVPGVGDSANSTEGNGKSIGTTFFIAIGSIGGIILVAATVIFIVFRKNRNLNRTSSGSAAPAKPPKGPGRV